MLTAAQINSINRARDACEAIQKKVGETQAKPFSDGQLSEACMAAELALFNVLNLAGVADGELFNRKEKKDGSSSARDAIAEAVQVRGPVPEILDPTTPGRTVA